MFRAASFNNHFKNVEALSLIDLFQIGGYICGENSEGVESFKAAEGYQQSKRSQTRGAGNVMNC